MPALQVRDFPDELYAELKACAEREHRSVAQQMIVAAEEMLARRAFAEEPPQASRAARRRRSFHLISTSPTEEERAERIRKRKRIFEEMDRLREEHPMPKILHQANRSQWIREDRDGRTDDILEASAGFSAPDVDRYAKGA